MPLPCRDTGTTLRWRQNLSVFNSYQPDIRHNPSSTQTWAIGCLDGTHFYLGLDGNHGSDIDLYAVFLHELAHGVGFLTLTDGATGAEMTDENNIPRPSVWDHFLFDDRQLKHWDQITDQERAASSLDNARLSWDGMKGQRRTPAVPEVLQPGTPALEVSTPAVISGIYPIGWLRLVRRSTAPVFRGEIMPVLSNSGGGNACAPFTGPDALAVRQKIALIDRGGMRFYAESEKRAKCKCQGRHYRLQCRRSAASGPGRQRPHHHHSRCPNLSGGWADDEGAASIPFADPFGTLCCY